MRLTRRAVVGGLAGLSASAAGLAMVSACGRLPFTAQPRVARIGYLWSGSELTANLTAAFGDGLRDAGWIEGRNLVIEYRTYRDHPEHIPDLGSELAALQPDVLFGSSTDVIQAYMRASDSIPIVFANATDPVGNGLITSYARPGGNVTGTSRTAVGSSLGPKLLDLLRQLVPGLARVAVVFELWMPSQVNDAQAVQTAAQSVGIDAQSVGIVSADGLELALETALAGHPQALISSVSGATIIPATNQPAIPTVMSFALQHGLPTITANQPASAAGALLYYGPEIVPLFRRAGSYHVDRILRGAKPADIPFEGPTVFSLVVNLTTARTLGIAIPAEFAAQVTEWIE
jgi:putative ABC transport system substrate-binding protein